MRLMLPAVVILIYGGVPAAICLAQPGSNLRGEVPWSQNLPAEAATNPGRSRVLPPPDASGPATRLASRTQPASPGPGNQQSASSWWDEDVESTFVIPSDDAARPNGDLIKSTQILAMVGDRPILAGDLLARVNEALQSYTGKVPEEELERQRWRLVEQSLPAAIEAKLVFLDFLRDIPAEQFSTVESNVFEQFDEKQLPAMIEQAKVPSLAKLDEKLRELGSSLDKTRRSFFEQIIAREMIRRNSEIDEEISHDELLSYYQSRLPEYEFPAQARWEQLTATCPRFVGAAQEAQARRLIEDMGNSVLRGAPLPAVARRHSQGPTRDQGGQHDWTTQGSLVSEALDHAIFHLPVGKLSRIIRDDEGFHIIRVLERKEAGRVPFEDAQVDIREQIKKDRREAKIREYLQRLHDQTYVWNSFQDGTSVANDPRDRR